MGVHNNKIGSIGTYLADTPYSSPKQQPSGARR